MVLASIETQVFDISQSSDQVRQIKPSRIVAMVVATYLDLHKVPFSEILHSGVIFIDMLLNCESDRIDEAT
jgi:hypothetical protein